MNKSPESREPENRDSDDRGRKGSERTDARFAADLASEASLERSRTRPDDPELAADWDLMQELRGLGPMRLPAAARARVVQVARSHRRAPWFLAAAAAMVAAFVIAVVWQAPGGRPAPAEVSGQALGELRLALNTIQDAGRRSLDMAARGMTGKLTVADLGLDTLPFADRVRPVLQPFFEPSRGGPNEPSPENHPQDIEFATEEKPR
ncbi:MAG: hypothetical protein RQ847_07145 [Wenzhouxiangellaceae bacterium]|nr:hypothetical protein [Wenzhouxiangellaceae bacterium]